MPVAIAPMQWADLNDISDVAPLNSDDDACIDEIFSVLKKFGKEDRFGINLLHKHFAMTEAEVLIESIDTEDRVLTLSPIKRSDDAVKTSIQTSWRLIEGGKGQTLTWCEQLCLPDGPNGQHMHRGHRQRT